MSNLNDDIETIEEAEFRLEQRKWEERKGLAKQSFFAMVAIIVATFGLLFVPGAAEKIDMVSDIIIMALLSTTSILGMYFGATTYADLKKK